MRPRTWIYFIAEAAKSVFRNWWMSLASIAVVMVTLFILGSFILLNYNLNHLSSEIKSQVEIIAFVEDGLSPVDLDTLRVRIISYPEAVEVRHVTREEAFQRLKEQMGRQGYLLEGYGDEENNPLRDSFEVRTREPEQVPVLAGRISRLAGIDRVDFGSEVVDRLFSVTRIINWVGFAFMLALGATALFLIANTIKLTVFSRNQEIMIMKSVGATDWFIRWPFIIEGLALGLVGCMVPLVALYYGYQAVQEWVHLNVPFVGMVSPNIVFEDLLKIFLVMGAGLGALGSSFSIRKFLRF